MTIHDNHHSLSNVARSFTYIRELEQFLVFRMLNSCGRVHNVTDSDAVVGVYYTYDSYDE